MEDLVLQGNKIIETSSWMTKDGNIGMNFLVIDSEGNLKELTIPKLTLPTLEIERNFYENTGNLNFTIEPVNGALLELKDANEI